MARRIKHAEVKRLALCKRGKNRMTTIYKSEGDTEYASLTKAGPEVGFELGELLNVIWPKGLKDADGDFVDTTTAIDSILASLVANGGKVDIEHDGEVLPRDAVEIVEVFTIQKSDERFHGWKDYDGNEVDVTGGAASRIKINDPDLRAAYRNGDWDGVSLFGPAAVEQVDLVAASQRVAARMGGIQETEMTKEELQAILDAQNAQLASLAKSVVESVLAGQNANTTESSETDSNDAEPKAEVEAKPTFTGDVNDPQALADYENALRSYELRKSIADGSMSADDIAEMRKSMSENSSELDAEAGVEAEDSAEVRALKVKLFKAQRGTNVPSRSVSNDDVDELAKSAEAEGLAIAALMNEHLGNAPDAGGMRVIG